LWLSVAGIVVAFVGLIALGVGVTVLNVLFAIAVCAFLIVITPRILKRAGGPGALGKPKPKDH